MFRTRLGTGAVTRRLRDLCRNGLERWQPGSRVSHAGQTGCRYLKVRGSLANFGEHLLYRCGSIQVHVIVSEISGLPHGLAMYCFSLRELKSFLNYGGSFRVSLFVVVAS